jgi:tRNA-dihydrouridine synthase B
MHGQFDALLCSPAPMLALAPMQDVTDLPFWTLMHQYGGPDVYFTEYFRVHATSNLEPWIVEAVVNNPTGRPAVAQMIGNDIPSLVRTAKELQQLPIAAVDLNLGCPAPVVYRKCAGGGLLREPRRIDAILGALREAVSVKFTVKTRIGFDDPAVFDELLPIFAKHSPDLLTVHGRTVAESYRSEVHYDFIARAVEAMPCPVLANGNVRSAESALEILRQTGAHGLMIGRGAIRNPWIFHQIRQLQAARSRDGSSRREEALTGCVVRGAWCVKPEPPGLAGLRVGALEPVFLPTGHDVLGYVRRLYDMTSPAKARETARVQKMKKYMNYIGAAVDEEGRFLHDIRRATTEVEFFAICKRFLDHDRPMPLEPFNPATRAEESAAV